jgi:hypothetical protein
LRWVAEAFAEEVSQKGIDTSSTGVRSKVEVDDVMIVIAVVHDVEAAKLYRRLLEKCDEVSFQLSTEF